jgi:CubicO group peptidase (beta-lactamase class C family)
MAAVVGSSCDEIAPMRRQFRSCRVLPLLIGAALLFPGMVGAQNSRVSERMDGFDAYMEKILNDWNAPGVGVAVVSEDKLVFAKGYGYRDYGKKLPFTTKTMCQIASNTKLFTAVAAGLLVSEGKLTWDKPVRESATVIQFYSDHLNNNVTLRDMLAHRTGITRHDTIWYRSDDTRKELFGKLKYMEPKAPLRTAFLYNNLMYAAGGYLIELQTGRTWEQVVRERLMKPLEMNNSCFSVADMLKQPEFGVGYTERRDSFELYNKPYYEDIGGLAPAGAIVSNLEELSHWLICLMNDGKYQGKQVIPQAVLKATLEPALAMPNQMGESLGYWELLNEAAGMGRWTGSYRGHLLAFHGGDLDCFHSQVSMMPQERLGVIVFVIGDHCASLYNTITYNVYERLLGLDETPWSDRRLQIRLKGKKASTEARSKAGADRISGTRPSHPLTDFAGEYEHPAYGVLEIGHNDGELQFNFHKMRLTLSHYHYDRFDTPDDERFGKWSVNFQTSPGGDIDRAVMSLDQAEATFKRRPQKLDSATLQKLAGQYQTASGFKFRIVLKEDDTLVSAFPGSPEETLVPYKGPIFRVAEFSDVLFEFVLENNEVKALKRRTPSSEFIHTRIGP